MLDDLYYPEDLFMRAGPATGPVTDTEIPAGEEEGYWGMTPQPGRFSKDTQTVINNVINAGTVILANDSRARATIPGIALSRPGNHRWPLGGG